MLACNTMQGLGRSLVTLGFVVAQLHKPIWLQRSTVTRSMVMVTGLPHLHSPGLHPQKPTFSVVFTNKNQLLIAMVVHGHGYKQYGL